MNVPQLLLDLGQPLQKGDIVRVEYRTRVGKNWRYVVRKGELKKSSGVHLRVCHLSSGRLFKIPAAKVVGIKRVDP